MKTALIVATLLVGIASTAAAQGQRGPADPRNRGGGNCSANPYNCADTPNPLTPPDTVWMEDMTWMDVRDAVKAGKTTVIIATGGIEPNGPWLALGKHNFVLKTNCDDDDPGIALNMFMTDPNTIRYEQRVKAGKATIDGVSLADRQKNLELGRKIVEMRATNTVAAIKKAIADRRKAASQ